MRKLSKIISLIIAAVMIFCMLPLETAQAARGRVVLGETKATAASSFELEVGDTMDLNFYNASGYVYKTDNGSVFWKTSDSKIVSVDRKGQITAVSAGKATISVTLTVAKTRTSYEGSATVTVKEQNVKVMLHSYETMKLIYPSVDEALAASRNEIKVQRVKTFEISGTYYWTVMPNVSIDSENKNEINIDFPIINGEDYIINATGLPAEGVKIKAVWNTTPKYASLRYEDAYMSEQGGTDITGINMLSFCEADPIFELYDENDVIIGRAKDGEFFEGINGVSGYLRYVLKSATGNIALVSTSTGTVRMTALNQKGVVYAVWTSLDGLKSITTNDFTVAPKQYVKPELGSAAGIVVTNKSGDDINWTGSDEWTDSVPATTTNNVLFYFLGSDGKKYSPCPEAYAASDINPLSYEYIYNYELDQASEQIANITSNGVLTTYTEGRVNVYIYQTDGFRVDAASGAELVGVLYITVTKAPDLSYIIFDKTIVQLTEAANTSPVNIGFTLYDQYAQKYGGGVNLIVTPVDNTPAGTIGNIAWNATNTGGTLTFNLVGQPKGHYYYDVSYSNKLRYRLRVTVY